MATPEQVTELRRCEAGFKWFEQTLGKLDDSRLRNTIYEKNLERCQVRLTALRDEVLFLYHALGIRDEAPP